MLCWKKSSPQPENRVAALRGAKRFERVYRPNVLPEQGTDIRDGGTYLITGGFGGIGVTLAQSLLQQGAGCIVLVGRTPLPGAYTVE